jgi:hypothetical protein
MRYRGACPWYAIQHARGSNTSKARLLPLRNEFTHPVCDSGGQSRTKGAKRPDFIMQSNRARAGSVDPCNMSKPTRKAIACALKRLRRLQVSRDGYLDPVHSCLREQRKSRRPVMPDTELLRPHRHGTAAPQVSRWGRICPDSERNSRSFAALVRVASAKGREQRGFTCSSMLRPECWQRDYQAIRGRCRFASSRTPRLHGKTPECPQSE